MGTKAHPPSCPGSAVPMTGLPTRAVWLPCKQGRVLRLSGGEGRTDRQSP